MRSAKPLHDNLRFLAEFRELLDVMQQVAVTQLQRLEGHLGPLPSVAEVLRQDVFPCLPPEAGAHPLGRPGHRGSLVLLITSDEGFVGPLQSDTVRQALAHAVAPTTWWLIGQRGARLLPATARPSRVLPVPSDGEAEAVLERVGRELLSAYRREGWQAARIVAGRFRSMTRQEIIAEPLLPLPVGSSGEPAVPVLIEPSLDRVMARAASLWVAHRLLDVFWSARRAEYAARALHIESSRQELLKQQQRLRYAVFKALHERIDGMVREGSLVQRVAAQAATRRVP